MSSLPNDLSKAIETEVSKIDFSAFSQAISDLSASYRDNKNNQKIFITSLAQRLAYIGVRLPATYSAILAVLLELKSSFPFLDLDSLLDLGAGPGTVLWAISSLWPEISQATLVERDREMLLLGQKLASQATISLIKSAQWFNLDLTKEVSLPKHDLVTISYALGELLIQSQKDLLLKAWQATNKILLIIEPGTMKGFDNIRSARDFLIGLEANVLAPCPHKNDCPILKDDWCHFSTRVERSYFHRRAKGGILSYEDEKFSYLVVSKNLSTKSHPRILRHPIKRDGHIHLDLCTLEGLTRITVSQKSKETYKLAKKLSWGDSWPTE